MTAGTDQPATLKMSESSKIKTISLQNSNEFSDNIHSEPSTTTDKDVVNSVRKFIKFTTDNEHFSDNSSQNLSGHLNSCQNVNGQPTKQIVKSKYVPGRDGDPVLEDHRILLGLLDMEIFYLPVSTNYMAKIQENLLTPMMRKMVTDWMLEVCENHELRSQVFLLAVQYLDRILSTKRVVKSDLQLLAAGCLFIASKLHEVGPLSVEKLVICTDCSIKAKDLHAMELKILDILSWELCSVTSIEFIHMFILTINNNIISHQGLSSSLRMLLDKKLALVTRAAVILCLAATEYQFYGVKPSVMAAAAMLLTIKDQCSTDINANLVHYLVDLLAGTINEEKANLIMLENSLRTRLDSWRRDDSGDFTDYGSSP